MLFRQSCFNHYILNGVVKSFEQNVTCNYSSCCAIIFCFVEQFCLHGLSQKILFMNFIMETIGLPKVLFTIRLFSSLCRFLKVIFCWKACFKISKQRNFLFNKIDDKEVSSRESVRNTQAVSPPGRSRDIST